MPFIYAQRREEEKAKAAAALKQKGKTEKVDKKVVSETEDPAKQEKSNIEKND